MHPGWYELTSRHIHYVGVISITCPLHWLYFEDMLQAFSLSELCTVPFSRAIWSASASPQCDIGHNWSWEGETHAGPWMTLSRPSVSRSFCVYSQCPGPLRLSASHPLSLSQRIRCFMQYLTCMSLFCGVLPLLWALTQGQRFALGRFCSQVLTVNSCLAEYHLWNSFRRTLPGWRACTDPPLAWCKQSATEMHNVLSVYIFSISAALCRKRCRWPLKPWEKSSCHWCHVPQLRHNIHHNPRVRYTGDLLDFPLLVVHIYIYFFFQPCCFNHAWTLTKHI